MTRQQRAVIFSNGNLANPVAANLLLLPDDLLIAADGGTRHALAYGLIPAVVVGDLDSITSVERHKLETTSTKILQHPRDKDETDLELALHYAVNSGFHTILIMAALGGRLDQTLGNLNLLSHPDLAGLDVRADDGVEELFFVHTRRVMSGKRGDIISLIPWGLPVTGITTKGLKWPLRGETLYPHKTRGISNQMRTSTASIQVETGILLCLRRRL